MRSGKMFKAITSFALVAAMVVPAIAVSPATADAKAKFSASSALLATGQKKSVSVKGAAKKSTFSWKSSNKKVATIKKGKKSKATITAKAAGTAKITCVVKKGKKKSTVSGLTIKVRQKITSFAMQNKDSKACTSQTIKTGEKFELKGAINNNKSGSTTNQTVKWTSSDTKIAKVTKKNSNSATVTGVSAGTATITAKVAPKSKTESKEVTCKITVSKEKEDPKKDDKKDDPKATPTPAPLLPAGTLYKQKYNVTRWYNPATAAQSPTKHSHDGYKNNNFAIWMVGFFDNQYSTDEEAYRAYGPDLKNASNAQYKDGHDFRGEELRVKGDFSYEGTNQKTILFQINYTKPLDYPILYKWEDGSSKLDKAPQAERNNVKNNIKASGYGKYGAESLKPGETGKLDINFTIPKDAINGDKDEATGENYGIYLYFPNRPDGVLAYRGDNTFHFKNFSITY
ncbi:MAG: hypothetical protein HFH14_10675 [Lachnospiraceae bacterium]|nr:hypothetical protein [Lachnospiraceae bacterium]